MANEKRLIDANMVMTVMNRVKTDNPSDDKEGILEKCVNLLHAAPTVDAVEVVHGEWVHHYYDSGEPIDDKWYCSECHMCNDHRRTWYCPKLRSKDGRRKER